MSTTAEGNHCNLKVECVEIKVEIERSRVRFPARANLKKLAVH
jgi:hypothetical protein